ncbi:hypothetical protein PAE9249_01891 [Paenibacillus sp. CECT 9249]|nr:hypothetical protein PAE9249_01891 [Paenibacillus sp. CECT 9249]
MLKRLFKKSPFDHEDELGANSTSNLAFTLEERMLTKDVSSGNIAGAHVGFAYTPLLLKVLHSKTRFGSMAQGFSQPSRC